MSTTVNTPVPSFEDKYPDYTTTGYWETNEEPEIHRDLLGNLKVERAASIASSGEVGLFCLLPRTRKELVLVDHSYHSLGVTLSKILLIKKLGAGGARELFVNGGQPAILQALNEVQSELPNELRSAMILSRTGHFYHEAGIRREWHYTPLTEIRKAERRLDRVRVVHGDLTDIADEAPFDILYVSNALEHTGRAGRKLGKLDLEKLLRPKGFILLTHGFTDGTWVPAPTGG